jgi:hypothetical protein|tara:strand:- start:654 stop:827 length:174 start_codon:yes stop_codon:yes gene_type:complete
MGRLSGRSFVVFGTPTIKHVNLKDLWKGNRPQDKRQWRYVYIFGLIVLVSLVVRVIQ